MFSSAQLDEDLLLLIRRYLNHPQALVELLRHRSRDEISAPLKTDTDCRASLERDVGWLEYEGHSLVLLDDPDYPALLRQIDDPPLALWIDGDRSTLVQIDFAVSIVGSRKASQYGRNQATQLAAELSRQGAVVVSGLALGIDAAAHEGALESNGITVAVLGSGCDEIYPRRHWRLADRIREHGLIISEFPPGTPAYPGHFPRRNRIVTGLSEAVIVVEAAPRSGSLVSARLGLSQGREVMAVPGPVSQQNTKGCHQLIRDGALLVETADDVLRGLGRLEDPLISCSPSINLSPAETRILDLLSVNPSTIDHLVAELGQEVDEVTVSLVSLEVMGHIFSEGGIYHARHQAG